MSQFPLRLLLLLNVLALAMLALGLESKKDEGWRRHLPLAACVFPGLSLLFYLFVRHSTNTELARNAGLTASLSMLVFLFAGIGALGGRVLRKVLGLRLRKPKASLTETVNTGRRRLLLALPQGTAALGGAMALGGISTGQTAARLRRIEIAVPNLPKALDGYSILQLSDLHLGPILTLADLDRGLEVAREARPDLVVVTGDVVDEPELLRPALEKIAALNAPDGAYACLGNHEYLRRVPRSEAYWRQAGVELLFGRNVSLFARGVRISLSGVDDPMELRPAKVIERLSEMIEQVADTLDADSTFRILLSHRPEAFLTKGMARFDLVLSGHTHGGQMAAFGRSFLDLVTGRDIHWGRYTKTLLRDGVARQAALYTTSGFGDWFAFRLACPRELPLIILRRA